MMTMVGSAVYLRPHGEALDDVGAMAVRPARAIDCTGR